MLNWLSRVARLDNTAFDEIKLDPAGMVGGIVAVVITNLILGIGTYLYGTIEDLPETGDLLVRSLIIGTIVQSIVWMAWPGVTYLLLTSIYNSAADIRQLIATMGFGYVPAVIGALFFISFLDTPFVIVGLVAAFVLTQYAVAAASNAGSAHITMANLGGLAVFAVLMGIVVEITGDVAAGDYPFANGIWFLDWLSGFIL